MTNTKCSEVPVTTNKPLADTVEPGANFVDTKILEFLETAVFEVRECLKKTAMSHIVLGRKIAALYNNEYGSDLRRKLVTDDVMSDPTFSMYVKIGSSKVLANEKHLGSLPSAFNSLYHLAKLSEDELEKAILSREVSPSLLVEDARGMKKSGSKRKKGKAGAGSDLTHTFSFKITEDDWQKYRKEIESLLAMIESDHQYLNVTEVK